MRIHVRLIAFLAASLTSFAAYAQVVALTPVAGATLHDPGNSIDAAMRACTVSFTQSTPINAMDWKINIPTTATVSARIFDDTLGNEVAYGTAVNGTGTETALSSTMLDEHTGLPETFVFSANHKYRIGFFTTATTGTYPYDSEGAMGPWTIAGSASMAGCWSGALDHASPAMADNQIPIFLIHIYVPTLGASPTSLDFGSVPLGTISAAQTVTVTSKGSAPLVISGVSFTGANAADFIITSGPDLSSGAYTVPSAGAQFSIACQPLAHKNRTATFLLASNDPNQPFPVTLTCVGSGPQITISPATTTVSFGAGVAVGTSSSPSVGAISITNTGDAPLHVYGLTPLGATAGDYSSPTSFSNFVMPVGTQSATINVTFTPSTTGPRNGSAVIVSNDLGNSHALVNFTATGAPPAEIALDQTALDFGGSPLNQTKMLTLTITNNGSQPLNVNNGSLAITGTDASLYTIDSSTGLSQIAAHGGSGMVTVDFLPTVMGSSKATLTITSNALHNGTVTVPMTGTGLGSGISPTQGNYDFGAVQVGSTSPALTIPIYNQGDAPLNITGLAASPSDFQITSDPSILSTPVAPHTSIPITITYTPSASGSIQGSLIINDDDPFAPNDTVMLTLSGSGVSPVLFQSTHALDFNGAHALHVGTPPLAQSVTLTNIGNVPIDLGEAVLSDAVNYTVTSTVGTLQPNASTTFYVNFLDENPGTFNGTVTITPTTDGIAPVVVTLSANTLSSFLTATPTTQALGDVVQFNTNTTPVFTVTNVAADPITLATLTVDSPAFTVSAPSKATLNNGDKSTFTVTCEPHLVQAYTGTVHIGITKPLPARPSEAVVTVTCNGIAPQDATFDFSINPDFGLPSYPAQVGGCQCAVGAGHARGGATGTLLALVVLAALGAAVRRRR